MKTVEHNYSGYGTEGTKYQATKELSTKEIATLIRKELKSEVFTGLKFSVRSDYNHISVEIVDAPEDFEVNNPAFYLAHSEGRTNHGISRYTENAQALLDLVKGIVKSYNFDDCDSMIDYFNVKFYNSVQFSYERF